MRYILHNRRIQFILAITTILVVFFSFTQLMVRAATFAVQVDSDLDGNLATLNANATCELREVIASANMNMDASGGACTFVPALPINPLADDFLITFDAAVTNIELVNELPIITANVTIDGGGTVTLEEAAGQTVSYGLRFAPDPLDPTDTNPSFSTVTGLTIQEFQTGIYVDNVPNVVIGPDNEIINNRDGIFITGMDAVDTIIDNNFIGVDSTNTSFPNTRYGIYITGDASQTIITNNVIAENGSHGIYNVSADLTQINNNDITNNGGNGVYVVNSQFVDISNNSSISGNSGIGVFLSGSDDASIMNNPIDGNGNDGIRVNAGSSDVLITGNAINNNGGDGVRVAGGGSQALIADNTFSNNGGLGIDLGANGVNGNDGGDGDTGANGLQNYPVVTVAATDGAVTYVQGNFPAQAGVYDFIFYTSATCDPSNFGEGEVILDTTTGNMAGAFAYQIAGSPVGAYLTVIAINQTAGSQGNTSEFSRCIQIVDDTVVVDFTPMNVTATPGTTINFINQSSGIILGYTWTVRDGTNTIIGTANTVDFSFTFPGVDDYTVELCVTTVTGTQCEITRVTIVQPTATPTPIPIPATPIPPTATATATGTVTSTATNTLTSTATSTLTQTSTSTLTQTSTSTLTQTSTSTLTSTATSTLTQTSTSTLTQTSTSTLTQTSTSTLTSTVTSTLTQTATMTGTPTGTTTPDIDVTLEDLDENTMGVNVFNASDFDVSDVELVIDPRSAIYSSTSGSFTCVETGGILNCTIPELAASGFATQVVDCDENSNVNCSAEIGVSVDGAQVTIINEPYIIKVGEPPVANAGAEIVYTIRVVNPLNEPIFDVTVTDRMPTVMRILDSEASEGTVTITGQDILFELDELGATDSVAFTITTQVRDDFVFNQIVNSACLSSSENPDERCAFMRFLRTGGLPATGEMNFITRILQSVIVPLISGLMLVGMFLFIRSLRRTEA